MKLNEVIKSVRKFSDKELAKSYSNRTVKTTIVVIGDNNKYWVCTGKEFAILNKAGYRSI